MNRGILALVGTTSAGPAVAAAAERHALRSVEDAGALAVYAGDGIADQLMGSGALVLGDIYSLSGATCHAPADGWGNYLAFTVDGESVRIERAALTGLPIYWSRFEGGFLLWNDLELVTALLGVGSFDWQFIAEILAFANLRTARTGLEGVSELLPGTAVTFSIGEPVLQTFWTPWKFVERPDMRPVAELAPDLERRLIRCLRGWCGNRSDIMLELSGGLDSSIVAAGLSAAQANFSAVTFVSPGADGDERHYARAVAAHCRADLIEMPHTDTAIDLVSPPRVVHARPAAYGVLGGIDDAFEAAFPVSDVAIFGGIGGDNIFDFDTSVAPILDAFRTFGPRRPAFETMRDVARAGDATIWQAARLAYRATRDGPSGWRRETDFCVADNLPASPPVHAWDDGEADATRGKRNHVRALRRILDFVDRPRRWRDRDVVAPLLSQPVVEFCLTIPSWAWVRGGRDRAVARAAFASRLPPEIVWRRGKGRLDSLCTASYLRQRAALADLLLGGRLAECGLLDKPVIETYLTRDLVEGDFAYFRLLEIADVERWLRSIEAAPLVEPSSRQRLY